MKPNENAPEPAATGIEGNENRTNTHEGTDSTMQSNASTTLAEQIGADWDELDDTDRSFLTEAHAKGIRLDFLQYLARNTVANRGDEAEEAA